MKYFLISILLLSVSLKAAAQPGFDRIYSFSPYPSFSVFSGINSILPDTQQILVVGNTFRDSTSFPNPFLRSAAFIASCSYGGNVLWKKWLVPGSPVYRSTYSQHFNILSKIRPGKFVFFGHSWDCTTTQDSCTAKPFLYFFGPNGDSIRFVPVPYDNNYQYHFANSMALDKRSNIILGGTYWSNVSSDTAGIWIAKYDSAGSLLWRKVVADTPFIQTGGRCFKAIEGNGNSYLFAGLGATPDTANYSLYAVWKTDTAGNVLWRRQLPRTPGWNDNTFYAADTYFDIIRAGNGSGYYFMATCPRPVQYPGEPVSARQIYYCGKLDEDGHIAWSKRYDRDSLHYEYAYGLEQRANGDLLFAGQSNGGGIAENTPSSGSSLFCTDSLGNVKWFRVARRYSCPYEIGHALYSMKVAPGGNIVRGGYIGQFSKQPGCYDTSHAIAWLVMTDSLGRRNSTDTVTYPLTDTVGAPVDTGGVDTGLAIRLIPDDEKPYLSLYPNPAGDNITVKVYNLDGRAGHLSLVFYDYTGRQVLQRRLKSSEEDMDISLLPGGLYMVRLYYGDMEAGSLKVLKR